MLYPRSRKSILLVLTLAAVASALGNDGVEVAVSGAGDELAENIRAHLNLERLSCDISELHLRNTLSGADEQMSRALRALGYYRGQWDFRRQRTGGDDNPCWRIDIEVTANEPATIGELDMKLAGEGEHDPGLRAILADVPLAEGDQVHHGRYEAAKKAIRRAAMNRGYFDSRFTESRLVVDRSASSAAVHLTFDTGPRYRFGDIAVAETPLDRDFITDFLPFAPGDPFDARQLIRLQNNLINSGYFDQVYVSQGEPDNETRTVDIALELTAKSRYESTFGVGFSTDLGPRLSYQLRNRRFNSAGDTYKLTSQFSPVNSRVGFQFEQPGKDPVNEKTVWSLGWQREDTDTYTSHSYNGEVSRIRAYDNGWVRTASLSLLVEDFDIASDSDNVIYLYPGIHWQKSRANDHRYPTRGWRLTAGFKGGLEEILSASSFFQMRLGGKAIVPLLGGRLIGRADLGTTFVDDFSSFPASLRYYAGGDNSVRGFDYESLGPVDDNGEVVGGKHLLTGSVEYDHRVYRNYSAAIFYDAGNAFDTDAFTIFESIGFGVRWHSPVGTIRADLAFPLEEDGLRLHISMGPEL